MNAFLIFFDILSWTVFILWGLVILYSIFDPKRPVAGIWNWVLAYTGLAWIIARWIS